MSDADVRPEEIHTAAKKVDAAGQDWGESIDTLTTEMESHSEPYGNDRLGVALKEMYETIGPTAFTYLTETGFCVLETGVALNKIAKEYTVVEEQNRDQGRDVQDIVDSLGKP